MASFLEWEEFHERGRRHIEALENGDYVAHLPMLVVVEVTSAVGRQARRNRAALLATWKQTLADWERQGKVVLHELDRARLGEGVAIAERHRLRGSDAVVAALAEELDMPLKTFDSQVLARFHRASV